MKNKYLRRRLIFCLIILFLLFFVIFITVNNNKKKSSNNSNKSNVLEKMNYTYESRIQTFEEFDTGYVPKYGWLQVQGTKVDAPIVSKYYTGVPTYSFGWLASGYVGYDTRKVLVGHNVLNVSKKPMVNDERSTDFEDLMSFVYYDFAKENMYLVYTEDGKDKVYVIYAIGFYDYNYKYDADGLNKEEVSDYLKYVKENSIYKYDVDVNDNDDIITVKTCTRMFGLDEKQQFQIDARLVRDNEEMYKYKVTKTKLYKEYNLNDSYK